MLLICSCKKIFDENNRIINHFGCTRKFETGNLKLSALYQFGELAQTRRQSYTRMVKLRRDFMKLLHICTLTKQREDRKAELIEQDFRIIKSRLTNGDFKNDIYAKIKPDRDKANLEQRRLNGIAVSQPRFRLISSYGFVDIFRIQCEF